MNTKKIEKKLTYSIKLPNGEEITPGPGTVPTSHAAPKDSLKKMIEAAREVSKAGIFDTENKEYGTNLGSTTK
jgi:hypothetical protein